MKQLFHLKIFILFLFLAGCQKLKPEDVSIPEYPDFKELMLQQVEALGQSPINKEVWLEGNREAKVMEMDSAKWAKELSFLKELNPNQPEYVGAFEKSTDEKFQVLTLGDAEGGPLKTVKYNTRDKMYQHIQITFHEDKDVYVHHRDIEMNFQEGVLSSFKIEGYQKMMFKDTVRIRVIVNVKQT